MNTFFTEHIWKSASEILTYVLEKDANTENIFRDILILFILLFSRHNFIDWVTIQAGNRYSNFR